MASAAAVLASVAVSSTGPGADGRRIAGRSAHRAQATSGQRPTGTWPVYFKRSQDTKGRVVCGISSGCRSRTSSISLSWAVGLSWLPNRRLVWPASLSFVVCRVSNLPTTHHHHHHHQKAFCQKPSFFTVDLQAPTHYAIGCRPSEWLPNNTQLACASEKL